MNFPHLCHMDIQEFRDYCLAKHAVTEGFPFGEGTLVFKVAGKMFALCGVDKFDFVNLKCDPERAIQLREEYPAIQPGYHMHKQQWNSVYMDGSLPRKLVIELINHSYELVVKSLPKKVQAELFL